MDTQEVRDLYEAYLRVHQPQELTEEVEIAAQYFYEMGLNEEGVEILIEELGVEEFGEFVYDLAEEYYLTEARAGGVRVEPVTAKGGKFKGGKPTGKSLERLRAKKAARREAEASASEAKPSGLKSSLQRQSAIANAKKQQPKKKGILDRVAGAVLSGMERHNKAMGELKKMKSATAETAGKVKKAAGEFKKGFVGEEVEQLDEEAPERITKPTKNKRLMKDAGPARLHNPKNVDEEVVDEAMSSYDRNRRRAAQRAADRNAARDRGQTGNVPGVGYVSPRRERETYTDSAGTERHKTGARMPKKEDQKESYDLFDTILEYLIAEGYADTNENALVIMANMSEEWRQSIVEQDLTARQKYLVGKVGEMNKKEPGSAHKYTSGKQNPGAALDRANTSAMQMRGV